MTHEYKVGDKVRILFNSYRSPSQQIVLISPIFCDGAVNISFENKLTWSPIDLRHFAATLNALADKIEEAKNV